MRKAESISFLLYHNTSQLSEFLLSGINKIVHVHYNGEVDKLPKEMVEIVATTILEEPAYRNDQSVMKMTLHEVIDMYVRQQEILTPQDGVPGYIVVYTRTYDTDDLIQAHILQESDKLRGRDIKVEDIVRITNECIQIALQHDDTAMTMFRSKILAAFSRYIAGLPKSATTSFMHAMALQKTLIKYFEK